jgi:hypothetical protein
VSEPKRYRHHKHFCGLMKESDGEWVKWHDYAALKAEVERLNHKLGRLLGAEREWELVEPGHYAALKAENERLRSGSFVTAVPSEHYDKVVAAGDAMLGTMLWAAAKNPEGPATKRIEAWIAAKEGRDAK